MSLVNSLMQNGEKLAGDAVGALNTKSSLWGGLNTHLIARFFEVEKKTDEYNSTYWVQKEDSPVVKAPLSEGTFQADFQWTSPFERAGAESKAPSLFAMLQSGSLQPVVDALMPKSSAKQANEANADSENSGSSVDSTLQKFEGRTGITKLNSTQIFEGMSPIKMNVTAIFRAWQSASSEVEAPLIQLKKWALPEYLASDTTMTKQMVDLAKGENDSFIEALLPSKAPTKIGMTYKGRTWKPLVIEGISYSLTSPINSSGDYVQLSVELQLATLTAMDREDWQTISLWK